MSKGIPLFRAARVLLSYWFLLYFVFFYFFISLGLRASSGCLSIIYSAPFIYLFSYSFFENVFSGFAFRYGHQ